MKGLTLRNIAQACGGIYRGKAEDLDREITAVTTDSRNAEPGGLFAAIRGERADGHNFIPSVFEKGALAALSERELPEASGNYIQVTSTVDALGAIAAYYLEQLQIPVVGITGSVGKTSTKEAIASVLSQKYHVLWTDKNFNNALGLPLTVFRLREEHEIVVLEMGINHFGEMHALAGIARPDTCVITNIGECHLEFLGDRDGVLRAKSEIFDYLRPDGHVILNGDDDKLRTVTGVKGIRPVFFGIGEGNSVYADHIEPHGLDWTDCRIHTEKGSFDVRIPMPGMHMVRNALAGAAVGLQYGLTAEQIRAGIENLKPVEGRFNAVRTGRFLVIDDCYNANPMSMRGSLQVLQDAPGRRVAILGDMGELGENEAAIHREVGAYAGSLRLDCCICVGTLCRGMAEAIRAENPQMQVLYFAGAEELLGQLDQLVRDGDAILVKASHFMHFERIVERLKEM